MKHVPELLVVSPTPPGQTRHTWLQRNRQASQPPEVQPPEPIQPAEAVSGPTVVATPTKEGPLNWIKRPDLTSTFSFRGSKVTANSEKPTAKPDGVVEAEAAELNTSPSPAWIKRPDLVSPFSFLSRSGSSNALNSSNPNNSTEVGADAANSGTTERAAANASIVLAVRLFLP